MIIRINDESETPIYMQIHDQVIMGISNGSLESGAKLPTVRALATEIGVNTMTVSKAYQLLKNEGYIVSDRRSGARVKKDFSFEKELSQENKEALKKIASEARVKGMTRQEFIKECQKAYGGEEL